MFKEKKYSTPLIALCHAHVPSSRSDSSDFPLKSHVLEQSTIELEPSLLSFAMIDFVNRSQWDHTPYNFNFMQNTFSIVRRYIEHIVTPLN